MKIIFLKHYIFNFIYLNSIYNYLDDIWNYFIFFYLISFLIKAQKSIKLILLF